MNKTIEYYDQNAEEFISGTINADMSECRERFLKHVKPGGKILDAGCGSGRDSLAFMNAGFQIDAFDASQEICRRASALLGIPVECKRFEEITGESEYDGIWACASLLHVSEKALPDVMNRLVSLLKPDGVIYASFKEGNGERMRGGRFFLDMTEEGGRNLFEAADLDVLELFINRDVRQNRADESWVNIIGKKRQ